MGLLLLGILTLAGNSTIPGGVIRWSVPSTTRCGMKARTWRSVGETCYYPVDLEQRLGEITIVRYRGQRRETTRVTVEAHDYGTQEITLPDIPQAHPSPADLRRAERERLFVSRVFRRGEGPPRFTLPLGPPAHPLPKGEAFGVKRIFDGKPAPNPHTGIDFPVPIHSPVLAVADGTVVLARDLFYEGQAVMIDHGDGLISEYFHLEEIRVKVGEKVNKGHTLGLVGSTGRATGPHLFFGIRWHDARINPGYLLEDPEKIPAIEAGSH